MFFKSNKTQTIIENAVCGKYPPGEIVIRAAYCNFKCVPCFAAGYSHVDKINSRKTKDIVNVENVQDLIDEFYEFKEKSKTKNIISKCSPPEFNWFRVVGGEPLISLDNLIFLQQFFLGISGLSGLFGGRVVIQTNGMFLGSQPYEVLEPIFAQLSNFKGKIVLEISIKGSNRKEFAITTGRNEKDYDVVFRCIDHMQAINKKYPNIDFVAIAGFGPNVRFLKQSTSGYKITLFDPASNTPFFHPDNWDTKFSELHSIIIGKYNSFANKMPMAGLEDRPNWRWGLPAIQRAKSKAPQYMYDSYNDSKNELLEKRMEDIKSYFFVTDPAKYYPSLF